MVDKPRIRMDAATMSAIREDGWANLLSSIGTRRDPSEHITATHDLELPREQADAIYRSDGIGRRIVDLPAEEMTRQWVSIEGSNSERVTDQLSAIGAKQNFNKALRWSGLYGGAVAVMLVDDGHAELSEPLNESAVRGVNDLIVYDRWQTNWDMTSVSEDIGSKWFGRAERLRIRPMS